MKIVYIGYRSGTFETEDKQQKNFESVDLSCVNEGMKPKVITVSKTKFDKFKAAYKVTDEMIIGNFISSFEFIKFSF